MTECIDYIDEPTISKVSKIDMEAIRRCDQLGIQPRKLIKTRVVIVVARKWKKSVGLKARRRF